MVLNTPLEQFKGIMLTDEEGRLTPLNDPTQPVVCHITLHNLMKWSFFVDPSDGECFSRPGKLIVACALYSSQRSTRTPSSHVKNVSEILRGVVRGNFTRNGLLYSWARPGRDKIYMGQCFQLSLQPHTSLPRPEIVAPKSSVYLCKFYLSLL